MFEEIGHHVEKIRRVEYGPLVLDLPPGESRELTTQEVQALYRATKLTASTKGGQQTGPKSQPRSGLRPERSRTSAATHKVSGPRPSRER